MASTAVLMISPDFQVERPVGGHPVADHGGVEPVLVVGVLVVAGTLVAVDRIRVALHRRPQRLRVDLPGQPDEIFFDMRRAVRRVGRCSRSRSPARAPARSPRRRTPSAWRGAVRAASPGAPPAGRARVHPAMLLDRRRRAQEPVGLPVTRPGVLPGHEQPLRLERIQLTTPPNQTAQPRPAPPNPRIHTTDTTDGVRHPTHEKPRGKSF